MPSNDLKLNLSDSIFFLEQNELFIKFGKTFGQVTGSKYLCKKLWFSHSRIKISLMCTRGGYEIICLLI